MNLDNFIVLERERINNERTRLNEHDASARSKGCPVLHLEVPSLNLPNCKRKHNKENQFKESNTIKKNSSDSAKSDQPITEDENVGDQSFSLDTYCNPENELENMAPIQHESNKFSVAGFQQSSKTDFSLEELQSHLSKAAKDWANQGTHKDKVELKRNYYQNKETQSKIIKDDMEQWVTDTFYSYFPGFNNELQKRQNYLRERQQEYQQNLLKHQMSQKNTKEQIVKQTENGEIVNINLNKSTRSNKSNKTDLEIINVNNPNYEPSKYSARPGSTRHKLLQDLKHTELSNIVGGDGVTDRNRQNEELALVRKKDYQRELMEQIEEKRRSIELLREKERKQDESITRRLQEQLKTINLEEQLEKERIRSEKVRFDAAQNCLIREQLLAKLENDSKQLNPANKKINANNKTEANKENKKEQPTTSSNSLENNKVYQYFSNSARREYHRGQPLSNDIELKLSVPEITKIERECFHIYEKICPLCDEPLKNYESCCLRCQRKLSLKMANKPQQLHKDDEEKNNIDVEKNSYNGYEDIDDCRSTFSLVCHKCERLYSLCQKCTVKSDVCRACHRKRNVCMNCRRTLCTFCLEEIACGKDTERYHINDQSDMALKLPSKNETSSEHSFEILEFQNAQKEVDDAAISPRSTHSNSKSVFKANTYKKTDYNISNNNLTVDDVTLRLPYSVNISSNSVFHPDYKQPNINAFSEEIKNNSDKNLSFSLLAAPTTSLDYADDSNIDRVRKETERRLSRYFKNYGDLAQHSSRSKSESYSKSTQTTPETTARRDIVLQDANNLSMPLLREMPKMTRKESNNLFGNKTLKNVDHRKIDNLKRRWEVPAVQKYTITPNSPKVLTQIGAIRKQLQSDLLFSDNF